MRKTFYTLILLLCAASFMPLSSAPVKSRLASAETDYLSPLPPLPYGAIPVEYIESTGKQWIDTGIGGNQISKIVLIASGRVRNQAWLGCGTNVTSNDRLLLSTDPLITATVACRFDGTLARTNGVCETATTIEGDILNQTIAVNGRVTPVSFSGVLSNSSVYLFAANYERIYLVSNGHKIYSVKFYGINGVLVRDFIPVRFPNEYGEWEGAMYDFVSGELFRNQGTDSFILGPDIAPLEY